MSQNGKEGVEMNEQVSNANPVLRLVTSGVCKSMAEARRIVFAVDPKRIDQLIEKRLATCRKTGRGRG